MSLVFYNNTTANQFGFKKNLSTEMCTFLLKEVVNFYRKSNTSVFICVLDATKAFDRVNHSQSFTILISGQVVVFLVFRTTCVC